MRSVRVLARESRRVSDVSDPAQQRQSRRANVLAGHLSTTPRKQDRSALGANGSFRVQHNQKTFRNWAELESCTPAEYYQPTTEKEVAAILKHARDCKLAVRVIGSGHSPNATAMTQGVLISLDKMDRLLDVDVSSCTVKVQAGIRLEVLHEVLDKYGLAMRNLGSISEQSIAGALATGTHGTGSKFGILASFVKGVKIMGADGQVWNCQSGGEHHALFKAAQCHLGVLGILLEVDIACEPAFFLRAIQQPSTLSSVLDNLDVLVDSAEHWRFWWFPHTSNCITWAANRMHGMSKEEKAVQLSRNAPSLAEKLRRAFVERLLGFHTFRVLLFLGKFIPGIIPTVNRFFFWLLFSRRRELCDRSDRVFNIDCLFQQYVDEWSIPREHTAEALRALERMVVDRGWKVHFPVEVRFVQGDDIPLSTCYGRDSCFIGVIMYRPFGFDPQDVQEYLMAFEKVMARLGGRPHWAKSFHFRRADFEKCYPRFAEFERVREQLDPEGLFDNDFSRNVFGQRAGEREQQDPSAVKK